MPLLSTLSYSALSGLGGLCLGAKVHGRRGAQAFQDEILAQVNERYESYLELEARITRAIKQFDLDAERSAREIAQKERRIEELERALETTLEQACALEVLDEPSHVLAEVESALDALEAAGTAGIEDASARADLERELAELRAELALSLADKDSEIERQEEMICSLSSCVASLEAQLETASTTVASTLETSIASIVAQPDGFTTNHSVGEAQGGDGNVDLGMPYAAPDFAFAGPDPASSTREQAELESLRQRVEELSPYVQRLADAQARAADLERRCDDLRKAREVDVLALQSRLTQLQAETSDQAEQARACEQLEQQVQELSPYVELLSETRVRVRELEGERDQVRREREGDVVSLQAKVAELEAQKHVAARAEAEAQLALAEEQGETQELREKVEQLSPFVQRLEEARARIRELESQCADVRETRERDVFALQGRVAELEATRDQGPARKELAAQLAEVRAQLTEAQQQLVDSQQFLSEAHGELAEARQEQTVSEGRVLELERRCETIRKKKDEQIEVLRGIVSDFEVLRVELDEKDAVLGQMTEKCGALERSKKRAAVTMRRLRDELAETEDMVREVGGDPDVLRAERAERRELLLSLFDDLDAVVEGMQSQERRLEGLDKVYDQTLREQEREISGLEERLRDLYLLMETAGSVIAQLEAQA